FYNLGHMVEGAVAHYQATGKRNFLDIAMKYADCVCREIGDGPGQVTRVPGHQIAEMALARLYLATGDKKYLDQAKYFLDKRGHTSRTDAYSQAHKPVIEQDEAVGHAVRAGYMYSGMADVAALTGDSAYIKAIDRIWDNIVGKKLYITGGVGATSNGEAFGANYELPNMTAYCETCAAIGNVYVNHRLFLLHGESKYYDVLERTLYNGLISGVALDGGSFFYPNPLASKGQHQREPWFGCACCPSNISRFIPSLPGYVYAVKDRDVYVNLYMSGTASLDVDGKPVELSQRTGYPWDGDIAVEVDKNKTGNFTMKLRIPGWVNGRPVPSDLYTYVDGKETGYTVTVNGTPAEGTLTADGYYSIDRKWKKGDRVELHLDMEPRVVRAHKQVMADRGRVAVERGPIVYCAEWPDNDFDIHSIVVNQAPKFTVTPRPDLLGGIVGITTDAQTLTYDDSGRLVTADVRLNLIPYYAWCHRGSGNMAVWLPQNINMIP
ncbi:MAG: glycoside hydrolase family 127 protein, partial [Duncaniella sp.]|nr:glycoside hydrolase family 127 protein [Duncaniella sp.]